MAVVDRLTFIVDTSAIKGLSDLLNHVHDYIREHEIVCADDIRKKDQIIATSCDFIEGICDIVGYYKGVKNNG